MHLRKRRRVPGSGPLTKGPVPASAPVASRLFVLPVATRRWILTDNNVVDHGVNEGEPVDEQYCEQVNEDQFPDPEPDGQHLDQDFPEDFEDGKFNPIL